MKVEGSVVQTADEAIQRVNVSPVDKCQKNVPRFSPDRDLSTG